MRRRRRHRHKSASVEINLAAMLDMAFQLLAFFILTFRPAPVEGHLQMHMPPPVPLTSVQPERPADTGKSSDGFKLDTLDIYITADNAGDVAEIAVGMRMQSFIQGKLTPEALRKLNRHLKAIFDTEQIAFDRVQLAVDGRLRYDDLMKIVDVCTKQMLPNGQPVNRISFIDLTDPDDAQASR